MRRDKLEFVATEKICGKREEDNESRFLSAFGLGLERSQNMLLQIARLEPIPVSKAIENRPPQRSYTFTNSTEMSKFAVFRQYTVSQTQN